MIKAQKVAIMVAEVVRRLKSSTDPVPLARPITVTMLAESPVLTKPAIPINESAIIQTPSPSWPRYPKSTGNVTSDISGRPT